MNRFIAVFLTAFLTVFAGIGPANADRPVPGYHYQDVCKNIPGKQTILDVTGPGSRYRFNENTRRPNDCVRVTNPHA